MSCTEGVDRGGGKLSLSTVTLPNGMLGTQLARPFQHIPAQTERERDEEMMKRVKRSAMSIFFPE